VLKGVVHLSSLKVSCRDLCSDNIGLSLDGELKLGELLREFLLREF
jgi:hypothetical protein